MSLALFMPVHKGFINYSARQFRRVLLLPVWTPRAFAQRI
jgi:hypothetical protein